jgi:hypothetical protein
MLTEAQKMQPLSPTALPEPRLPPRIPATLWSGYSSPRRICCNRGLRSDVHTVEFSDSVIKDLARD